MLVLIVFVKMDQQGNKPSTYSVNQYYWFIVSNISILHIKSKYKYLLPGACWLQFSHFLLNTSIHSVSDSQGYSHLTPASYSNEFAGKGADVRFPFYIDLFSLAWSPLQGFKWNAPIQRNTECIFSIRSASGHFFYSSFFRWVNQMLFHSLSGHVGECVKWVSTFTVNVWRTPLYFPGW